MLRKTAFRFFLLPLAAPALAADAITHYNVPASRLAIQGYDPVAYFTAAPVAGEPDITATHEGIAYRFFSDANRVEFLGNPAKYTPAYGGWCATAMAEGRKVEIDPRNFKIQNGRHLLFFKAWYANALTDWNKDPLALEKRADAAWKKLTGE